VTASEAVVVGAGPYGLSIAAHLRRTGLGVRVFGDVMAAWRHHMPQGMYLKSTPDASSLSAPDPGSTIEDYCAAVGSTVLSDEPAIPIDLFVSYGQWFAEKNVPHVEPERVVGLERGGRGFSVRLDSGAEVHADAVIVACGVVPYAYVPSELRALSAGGPVSHTSEHPDLSRFANRRVAVVGGGQSALESAALLAEAGADVDVLVRAPRVLWGGVPEEPPRMGRLLKPHSGLGEGWTLRTLSAAPGMVRFLPARARLSLVQSVLGPSGAWWLRDRVEPRVRLRTGVAVRSAVALPGGGARVGLAAHDGGNDLLEVDHVLAATGYRVDLDTLGFMSPALAAGVQRVAGSPVLSRSFESTEPGLFFTGLTAAATFGPLLRFVYGTEFASRRIGAALAARRRSIAA
jgi:hypothetical protein